ncbi:hypothetical protein [Streptomyces sp. NBC_01565]|uniref:hypothetical protein n=1 Tax=unclassified Streptomyces TaxID=2593676 RepID=UPI00225B705F|nr:hypothetical protein [Streptomyces sp. NBC_01565]MCX4545826.1 hypothetical protein [Streptomyces sp. NBC_01565]
MTGLAVQSSEILQHVLVDRAIKAVIVIVALGALGALALAMTVIWRRTGRAGKR